MINDVNTAANKKRIRQNETNLCFHLVDAFASCKPAQKFIIGVH